MELAYPNLLDRIGFPVLFIEMDQGEQKKIADSMWQAAYNEHSQPCLSLRLELQNKTIFYSGDGRPTPSTQSLARGCDIIIHEAYRFQDTTPGHGSIASCLEFCRKAEVKHLVLLHMQRDIRQQAGTALKNLEKEYAEINILLPEKWSSVTL
jgi:ribonuclease BN (tRNA processing enzyme)